MAEPNKDAEVPVSPEEGRKLFDRLRKVLNGEIKLTDEELAAAESQAHTPTPLPASTEVATAETGLGKKTRRMRKVARPKNTPTIKRLADTWAVKLEGQQEEVAEKYQALQQQNEDEGEQGSTNPTTGEETK